MAGWYSVELPKLEKLAKHIRSVTSLITSEQEQILTVEAELGESWEGHSAQAHHAQARSWHEKVMRLTADLAEIEEILHHAWDCYERADAATLLMWPE